MMRLLLFPALLGVRGGLSTGIFQRLQDFGYLPKRSFTGDFYICTNAAKPRRIPPPMPPKAQKAAAGRSGVAQGGHGALVCLLLRDAVAGNRTAVRHPLRHALRTV